MTETLTRAGVDGVIRLAAEPAAPTFHTVEAVEIAHVGMDWPASTGPVTLTFEHLQDAVTAANSDPHILAPRLKIGHTDPRFNEDPPQTDPFVYHGPLREDGTPVYGRVTNLRLAEDGMVLLGDYIEVPDWLYNALPSAYPSRSLEGDFDIQTEGGKTYSFVITAVALLGEPLPAITCLDDLVRELTGGPDAVAAAAPVTLRRDAMPVAAEASTGAVQQQFWNDYAQGDRYWWWPCEIRVEDGWVLADDDEGHYYRVPFTIDADGNVTFADAVPGVLDFREVAEPVAAARSTARFSSAREAGRPQDRVRPVAAATTTGGTTMADGAESTVTASPLLERLGLPEDATEEQIQEATIARLDELEAAPAPEPVPAVEPVAAAQNDRVVSVDREQFAALERDAQMGRDARLAMLETQADGYIEEARRDGRISPASATAWRTAILPEGATELVESELATLTSLQKGRIPVSERGVTPNMSQDDGLDRVLASFGITNRKER